MKIAVTGGTGFVGRHLTQALVSQGHDVVLIARGVDQRDSSIRQLARTTFKAIGLDDTEKLTEAFAGCECVAHCAGINREVDSQTYQRVHVEGTRHVVHAAQRARVRKVVFLSFLRARPDCGSAYHESKWAAEEIVRSSNLDYTVVKAAMIYGRGDHMLDHLSHMLWTLPVFAAVGFNERPVRPVTIEDMVSILVAALVEGRLSRQTVAVTGPEPLPLSEAVKRVAQVLGKRVVVIHLPVWLHYVLAWSWERLMVIPLVSVAQVRMLSEGMAEPAPPCDFPPNGLRPRTPFTFEQIQKHLPEPGSFKLNDFRLQCAGR